MSTVTLKMKLVIALADRVSISATSFWEESLGGVVLVGSDLL